jgi:hypothetical protein
MTDAARSAMLHIIENLAARRRTDRVPVSEFMDLSFEMRQFENRRQRPHRQDVYL